MHDGHEDEMPEEGVVVRKRRKGIYILPNLFTTAGLFLGVYAIIKASNGEFLTAAVAIVVAHLCDGLDGRIARLTNTTSRFGVEYDSLADLVWGESLPRDPMRTLEAYVSGLRSRLHPDPAQARALLPAALNPGAAPA